MRLPLLKILVLSTIVLLPLAAQSQLSTTDQCAMGKKKQYNRLARTQVMDAAEDYYDVCHVKFDIEVKEQSTAMKACVSTTAVVVADVMTEYAFELNPFLRVDSLLINNMRIALQPDTTFLRRASLPNSLTKGAVFTAKVYYQGTPPTGPGFFSTGMRNQQVPGTNNRATFSMSEPYDSRDWWPCKQSLTDKIDSVDFWITVADSLKVGSNGLLQKVTPLPQGMHRYEWKTNYPQAYYLISFAAAEYEEYSYYNHFTGSNDSMLVQNYLYAAPHPRDPNDMTNLDMTGEYINYFSELFGRYPFWKEKYGHCLVPLGGGMEHQTMTSLGYLEPFLIAHELGHQWWGDHVTCGTWHDIWLNEGFASYCEYLYAAHFRSQPEANAVMKSFMDRSMEAPNGSVYVNDTANEGIVFSGRLTYAKGATVLHMLRFEAGSDEKFFAMLKAYGNRFSFSTATTADLEALTTIMFGKDMSPFFRQWVYGEGYPTIGADWNQADDEVIVRVNQSASMPSSVAMFQTPLEVKLISGSRDTTFLVQLQDAQQSYSFRWDRPVSNVTLDPNNWLLNDTGIVYRNALLPVKNNASSVLVAPNPTTDGWNLFALPANSNLLLTDLMGRRVWMGSSDKEQEYLVPAQNLASGMYFLRIQADGGFSQSIKLLRR